MMSELVNIVTFSFTGVRRVKRNYQPPSRLSSVKEVKADTLAYVVTGLSAFNSSVWRTMTPFNSR